MYRIELSPGEETAFRSIEELAVAVRRGVVTSRSRIWHNASGKWLPIEFHPHYKIAASMQLTAADLAAGPPVKPLELLTLGELMDPAPLPAAPARPATKVEQPVRAGRTSEPKPAPAAAPAPAPAPAPAAKPRKKAAAKSRGTKSSRKSMRLALAGALLLACAQLAFSAASAARSETVATRPRSHRHLITEPTVAAPEGRPETTAAAVLPGLPAVRRPLVHSSRSAAASSSTPRPTASAAPGDAASLESRSEAATLPPGAFPADSAPAIQPAPTSVDIAAPAPLSATPLPARLVDSTGKKTLKRILRTVSGTPTTEQARPKR